MKTVSGIPVIEESEKDAVAEVFAVAGVRNFRSERAAVRKARGFAAVDAQKMGFSAEDARRAEPVVLHSPGSRLFGECWYAGWAVLRVTGAEEVETRGGCVIVTRGGRFVGQLALTDGCWRDQSGRRLPPETCFALSGLPRVVEAIERLTAEDREARS